MRTEKSATLLWSVDQYSLILQAQLHLSRLDPHPLIGNLLQVWGGWRAGLGEGGVALEFKEVHGKVVRGAGMKIRSNDYKKNCYK